MSPPHLTYGEDNFFFKPSGDGRTTVELSTDKGGFATSGDGGGEGDIVAHGEDIAAHKPMGDGETTKELLMTDGGSLRS